MTEKSTSSPQGTSSFSLFYSRLNGVTGHLRLCNLAEAVPPPGVLRESALDATPSSSPLSAEVADGGLPRGVTDPAELLWHEFELHTIRISIFIIESLR